MSGSATADVAHVVPGPSRHGVTRHALTLLAQPALAGHAVSRVADAAGLSGLPPAGLTHLHLTDHLFGDTAGACAAVVVPFATGRRVSLSLHDLPQPADGPGRYERRRSAYAAMAAAAIGIVVASEHEQRLLRTCLAEEGLTAGGPVLVIPLPVDRRAPNASSPTPAGRIKRADASGPDLVIFGFMYPGKGHAAALDALARLPAGVGLLALGAVSPGHEQLAAGYAARARAIGRRFTITGHVPDVELPRRLRDAGVPVAPHAHVSASGSINAWLGAGRRPLVPAGAYVDEVAERCPGALVRYGAGADATSYPSLADAARAALTHPGLTRLPAGIDLGPTAAECATQLAGALARWAP